MSIIAPVAVVAGVVAAVVASTRGSGALASVSVDGGSVVVRPRGANKLWALRGRVELPLSSVVAVTALPKAGRPDGLRAPGTSLPGVLYAGTFRRRQDKAFWLARPNRPALCIEARGSGFHRVVVDVADVESTAGELTAAAPAT